MVSFALNEESQRVRGDKKTVKSKHKRILFELILPKSRFKILTIESHENHAMYANARDNSVSLLHKSH